MFQRVINTCKLLCRSIVSIIKITSTAAAATTTTATTITIIRMITTTTTRTTTIIIIIIIIIITIIIKIINHLPHFAEDKFLPRRGPFQNL